MIFDELFLPKTLEDKVTQDGITAISKLDDVPTSRDSYFLVGGCAVQSYIPDAIRRPTADIDVCIVKPVNSREEFKQFSQPCIDYLISLGYSIDNPKKMSQNFKIVATNESGEIILLEFSRRNYNNFKKNEALLIREKVNSRKKIIGPVSIDVVSPEDIIVPKMVRNCGIIQRNSSYIHDIEKYLGLLNESSSMKPFLFQLLQDRASVGTTCSNELFRLKADCYDITCLSRYSGVNKAYFNLASQDWTNSYNSPEWNLLQKMLLLNFEKRD